VNAFDAPGRQAFVVEMVGREDMPNAIALNSLVFNSGRVIGPALGGLTLAAFGSAWCFLINGFSFLAVIAGLLLMNVPPKGIRQQELSPWKLLKSGFRYTLVERELLALILLALIFSFFGLSYSAVLPAFVDQSLHSGAQGYGAVNAATGLGAVAAALFVASNSQLPHRGRWMAVANFFFCGVLFFFALNHSYPAALLLGLGLGVGFMLTFTFINTLLQTRVVDEMRGRVMSLYTLTFFGIAPFGNLAIGALSQAWGLNFILTLSALVSAVLALMVFLFIPRLLALD
jgi:MFS family permease